MSKTFAIHHSAAILSSVISALILLTHTPNSLSLELGEPPTPATAPKGEIPAPTPRGNLIQGRAVDNGSVDIQNREAVRLLYINNYLPSNGVPMGFTGDIASCHAGDTSQAYKDATLARINYFRSMAGVAPSIAFDPVYSSKAQEAALMMAAQRSLSHTPSADSWTCYTEDGAAAASSSNLALGVVGPDAIDAYIRDSGAHNYAVGHRRWLLYPQTQLMGTGNVSAAAVANSVWVFDPNIWAPRPATREEYVSWPPPGHIPYQLVPPRWSFSYAGADFSSATVTMTDEHANSLPVALETTVNGYGENTLVWLPTLDGQAPECDTPYAVTIDNVGIDSTPTTFNYTVMLIDPAATDPGSDPQCTAGAAVNASIIWLLIKSANTEEE